MKPYENEKRKAVFRKHMRLFDKCKSNELYFEGERWLTLEILRQQ